MNILSILNEVAMTSSRTEKEKILTAQKDNATLKRVFKLAYDKQVLFWTRQIPDEKIWGTEPPYATLDNALDQIEMNIVSRKVTGNAAEKYLETTFKQVSDDNAEVLKRIILGDLRIGATSGTANKVWKDLIPSPDFMLAQTDDKKIVYPAFSQLKEDGTRGKFLWDGYSVSLISRNGNPIETLGVFDNWAQLRLEIGDTLDGELLAFDPKTNKRLPRKTGNGIVNKAVKGTISKEETATLRFVAWDLETKDAPYEERFALLEKLARAGDPVMVIESTTVNNYEEAVAHFRQMRKDGFEGTILKNKAALWVPKRSFDLVKFKAEIEIEMKVDGYELGTGKYADVIGALHVSSEDDRIKCDVGIFKDFPSSIREDLMKEMPKVVTVRYNERISRKGSTTESLFLPRVTALRWDKDVADTYEQILEIERNVLEG